jgi:alpha-beta hydrolase superfamily lysophospholipase
MRTPTATIELVVSSDGTQIAYQRSGSGPPLVLAHGTSGDRSSFRLVEPLLARRFTVCAVDRRGRGRSGVAPELLVRLDGLLARNRCEELLRTFLAEFVGFGPEELEGQGHVATMTAPELLAREVVRFLRHAETKEGTR